MKLYTNPYQNEIWEAMKQTQKQKDQIDNEIFYWVIKLTAFFLSVGCVFNLLKR